MFVEYFRGCHPAQAFAGLVIDLTDHSLEFRLVDLTEVGAFGVVAAEPAVVVLVRAPLPRRVRVSEVRVHPVLDDQLGMQMHLGAVIHRGRTTRVCREHPEDPFLCIHPLPRRQRRHFRCPHHP